MGTSVQNVAETHPGDSLTEAAIQLQADQVRVIDYLKNTGMSTAIVE
jgi:hypothetical protein